MKKIILAIISLLFIGCNAVTYTSITRPTIDRPGNEYFIANKGQKYEGNPSVIDINNRSNRYQTIVIENDGTYYYLD